MYIYQGDVLCDTCGESVREELLKKLNPEDYIDENQYDSDDFPKGPYDEDESDSPEHCGICEVFLENPLTEYGFEYVKEMVEGFKKGRGRKEILEQWSKFYNIPLEDE